VDRRNFIKSSCTFCVAATGLTALATMLQSCATIHVFNGTIDNNSITVPLSELVEKETVIIKSKNTESDIALVKSKSGEWKALLMLCTHASNPIVFNGSAFMCNVHFSEFNMDGVPKNGPAQKPLKILTTELKNESIVIKL
jgi:Rieske Fe-S protein